MSNIKKKEGIFMSHMTLDDRITIQECLNNGISIRTIAKRINKSPSTVMREIKKHKTVKGKRRPDLLDECAFKRTCNIYHLCKDIHCNSACRTCELCKTKCPNYKPDSCDLLLKSPYVCNGCTKYNICMFSRVIYLATYAQNCYEDTLISSREGIDLSPDELQSLDEIVSPLLFKGQSVDHIYQNHSDEIPCSRSTLYRFIDNGILSAKNINLPRKVKYKKRKNRYVKYSEATKMAVLSRNYTRFEQYLKEHPDISVVEMDTVIGTATSSKVLLTLLFRSCNLMLIKLLEHKTQDCVIDALNDISDEIGIDKFKEIFPVILTDRGMEFLFPEAIECDRNGEIKTKLFYCDPQCSWQKPFIERNHELIRQIIPKGQSFDNLNQKDIDLVMNHINSYGRKKLNGASPYQLSRLIIDNKLHKAMHLQLIESDNIILTPQLLSWKNDIR